MIAETAALRVGLVGVNTSHASAFVKAINGGAVEGACVTWVWAGGLRGDQPDAATLASRFGIGRVASHPTDLLDETDLVLIADDTGHGASHRDLAWPFLEAGIATFIDKPMVTDFADAQILFDLAERHSAPLMSSSALRHAVELAQSRRDIELAGVVSTVVSTGPGDWGYYGIHALELALAAVGPGVETVQRSTTAHRDVTVLESEPPRPTIVVLTLRDVRPTFSLDVTAANGFVRVEVRDSTAYYSNQMAAAISMTRSRIAPVATRDTLEVIATLHAGRLSAERRGQPVHLSEILGPSERGSQA